MQTALTHHLAGKMIAEMPVEDTVAHRQLLFYPQERLLELHLDTQKFGREGLLGFVFVLAALGASSRTRRFAVFVARFAFDLARFGLLLLLFGADHLLIGERIGLP